MYPQISRELVADPLGSAEHTLCTTVLKCLKHDTQMYLLVPTSWKVMHLLNLLFTISFLPLLLGHTLCFFLQGHMNGGQSFFFKKKKIEILHVCLCFMLRAYLLWCKPFESWQQQSKALI